MGEKPPILDYETPEAIQEKRLLAVRIVLTVLAILASLIAAFFFIAPVQDDAMKNVFHILALIFGIIAGFLWLEVRRGAGKTANSDTVDSRHEYL